MLIIGSMILSYGYDEILCMLFFSMTLNRRYSYKITALGTAFFWLVHCLIKLPLLLHTKVSSILLINGIVLCTLFLYQAFLYQATLVKRVLSMIFFYLYLFVSEVVSMKVSFLLVGDNGLFQYESDFTVTAICIMLVLLTLCFYPLICLWNLLLMVEKGHGKWQSWLCVLLPLSQYVWIEYLIDVYEIKSRDVPGRIVLGIMLGALADFYMFFLFHRKNQQYQAKQALVREQEIYSREQVYYESLQKSQEETAKIRHDFQNYILTLDHMAEGRRTNR